MIDIKLLKDGLQQLTEEKHLPLEKVEEAMERALAAAYQKEYGEKGQIIKCEIDFENGVMHFTQHKIVTDKESVRMPEELELSEDDPRSVLPRYNEERHIMIESAQLLKKNVEIGEELSFPLDDKDDFGRIALQTAKQVIVQAIREAERGITTAEFHDKIHTIVSGTVEMVERNIVFVDINKSSAILPLEEQIRNEKLSPGQRVRAYLLDIDESPRGLNIKLSRTHPQFLVELFKNESSEILDGIVEIVNVAREPGSRSKIAVLTHDDKIDPIGACVGQRGVRVNAITQELHGEKIDIILYDDNPREFIKKALSPAKPVSIEINEEEKKATVYVEKEEQSLAIGKGGQNVRLAARLTGYKIDIITDDGDDIDSEGVEDEVIMEGTDEFNQ
ncbi:MAG: transcription termination/antitermination protein NusA [Patescibacteria group bacterium]|nr:transcription termination/antitermination protein NusA [Patescibacteria group bacterium]